MKTQPANGERSLENKLKSTYRAFAVSLFGFTLMAAALAMLFMFTLAAVFDNVIVLTILSVIGGIIIFSMAYGAAWQIGYKDHNKVKYNHIRYNPAKGLIAGLLSQIPGFIIALFNFLSHYVYIPFTDGWIRVAYNMYYNGLLAIAQLGDNLHPVFYFLPLLVTPAGACVGYLLGYKDISVSAKLMYKKAAKSGDDKRRR